jgi:hypothetical protein
MQRSIGLGAKQVKQGKTKMFEGQDSGLSEHAHSATCPAGIVQTMH